MPVSSKPANTPDTGLSRLTLVFDALYISALFLLIIIVVYVWISSRIQRSSTWFMFMISLMLACIANLLLLGHQVGKPPPYAVCLAQAVMINAVPVLYVFYATTLVVQTYTSILAIFRPETARLRNRDILFHVVPCVAFLAIIIINLVFSLVKPKTATRYSVAGGVYCHFSDPLPKRISAGFILCSMLLFALVEIFLYRKMYLVWKDIGGFSGVKKRMKSGRFLRFVFISVLWPVVGILISSFQYIATDSTRHTEGHSRITMVLIILQACGPLAVALCVTSQMEFLWNWRLWKQQKHHAPIMSTEVIQLCTIDSEAKWEKLTTDGGSSA